MSSQPAGADPATEPVAPESVISHLAAHLTDLNPAWPRHPSRSDATRVPERSICAATGGEPAATGTVPHGAPRVEPPRVPPPLRNPGRLTPPAGTRATTWRPPLVRHPQPRLRAMRSSTAKVARYSSASIPSAMARRLADTLSSKRSNPAAPCEVRWYRSPSRDAKHARGVCGARALPSARYR